MARRSRNEPGASPYPLGNECVRKRTFTLLRLLQRVAPLSQFLETSSKLAHLRALRCDELSDQSRSEQDAPEDETRLDQIQQRTEAFSGKYSPEHSCNSHQDAQHKQRCSEHSEQQQWLLGKAQLEPYGEHVEHADWNSSDPELRLACKAGV